MDNSDVTYHNTRIIHILHHLYNRKYNWRIDWAYLIKLKYHIRKIILNLRNIIIALLYEKCTMKIGIIKQNKTHYGDLLRNQNQSHLLLIKLFQNTVAVPKIIYFTNLLVLNWENLSKRIIDKRDDSVHNGVQCVYLLCYGMPELLGTIIFS